MRTAIVIPARIGSTRLPGKPLIDLLGKPLIQHVLERAQAVTAAQDVIVATDDQRICDIVRGAGGVALLTSGAHPSGTDRIVEVMNSCVADLYINLQGDEPLIRPADIERLIFHMQAHPEIAVGTLYHQIAITEARNPNIVKVVCAANGNALYFSRALIPFNRDHDNEAIYYKHVGVYAYRHAVLTKFRELPLPPLEKIEKLEQLRLLHAGYQVSGLEIAPIGPGVDTPEDLVQVRELLAGNNNYHPPHLSEIRLLISDIDGVLTDGRIFYDATGVCFKSFHARDGLGAQLLEQAGVRVALVSGLDSSIIRARAADLGITLCYFGVRDKGAVCRAILAELGLNPRQAAFIGDDSIDLSAFSSCAFSFAVADAPIYIRQAATHVLTLRGGAGAFREVVDLILTARGQTAFFQDPATFTKLINN